MTPLAQGRIVLWQGGSLWIFDVPTPTDGPPRTDFHAHHANQITLALDGAFELHVGDRWVEGPAAVVAADVRHAFGARGLIALVFVEPESPAGRIVTRSLLAEQPIVPLPAERLHDLRRQVAAAYRAGDAGDDALRALGQAAIRELAGGVDPPPVDERVLATISWAAEGLDRRLSVSEAASHVGLSVDRMSHLFVEQTGLPFRTYLLWLRLTKAVQAVAAGASLTEAAHEAGFADSAHFSRTFRRMFGVAAAALRLP